MSEVNQDMDRGWQGATRTADLRRTKVGLSHAERTWGLQIDWVCTDCRRHKEEATVVVHRSNGGTTESSRTWMYVGTKPSSHCCHKATGATKDA